MDSPIATFRAAESGELDPIRAEVRTEGFSVDGCSTFCLSAALQPISCHIHAANTGMSPPLQRRSGRSYGDWPEVFGGEIRTQIGGCRPGV